MREGFRQALVAIVISGGSMLAQAQSYITDKVVVGVYENPNADSVLLKALPTGTPLEILERSNGYSQIRTPDGTTGWIENTYIIDNKPAQLVVLELTDKQQQTQKTLAETRKQLLDMQEQVAGLQDQLGNSATPDNSELKKQQQANRALQKQLEELQADLGVAQKKLTDTTAQRDQLIKDLESARNAEPATATEPAAAAPDPASEAALAAAQANNAVLQQRLDAVVAALQLEQPLPGPAAAGGVQLGTKWIVIGILLLLAGGFIAGMKALDWLYLKRHGGFRI